MSEDAMANPQHIEWLKEGVEAWNARRQSDNFVPDLSKIGIDDVLKLSNSVDFFRDQEILRGIDFSNANLSFSQWAFFDL
ncbi:hypothetical protein [uncultured Pelagimonas sp.]|uniref:hypothetical protein n=1 Tax=uncultured Pelagimonas sp. TaxID=1618102 RepID=UPI00261E1C84|nr:hypothetical protein [uncultured Pelagimonas sp.]